MKRLQTIRFVGLLSILCVSAGVYAGAASAYSASDEDAVLTQGKEMYAAGQYMPALDKFMKVLRRDPRNPEAREYLRLVVDQLRQQRSGSTKPPATMVAPMSDAKPSAGLPPVTKSAPRSPAVAASLADQESAAKLRKRQLLSTDLAAIPGVKVRMDSKNAYVEIDTGLLFADKTGGLREEGVPLLDRVSAWLKTFSQEPIAVHCLPEELDDLGAGGALYLHRYAQLYGFFVDERRVPAARFVAAGPGSEKDRSFFGFDKGTELPRVSTSSPKILIVSVGGADSRGGSLISPSPSRWLEFSLMSQPAAFNPDEGEWATMDLAALAPMKARTWKFVIAPVDAAKPTALNLPNAVYVEEGTGNLFKRISWDGRNKKSGRFVAAGKYLARLEATNADGTSRTQDAAVEVKRTHAAAPVAVKPASANRASAKPKPAVKTVKAPAVKAAAPVPVAPEPPVEEPAVPVAAPAEESPVAAAEDDGSSDAIWKQVIQFDANDSDLKPTVKASLERIGKTLEVYPLQKVRIAGFAETNEANPAKLGRQRADRVRETLISEYQVDPKRVLISEVRVGGGSKVEISITN